jgi:prepilin signal peptidase PulO-like enzyme (type II secretory pathway)
MPPHPVLAVASLLCGLVVGLAVNRLLKQRLSEGDPFEAWPGAAPQARQHRLPPSWRRGDRAGRRALGAQPRTSLLRPPRQFNPLLLHPLLLGAASLALSLLPGLSRPLALFQALLLLYVLYPLALVDLVTLTIEPALVLGGVLLRMGAVLTAQRAEAAEMLAGLLAGAGLLALVAFAYRWLRGRDGLGEGDAAVLGLIGAFVGWHGLLPVVLLATSVGLLAGLPALLLLRKPLHTPLPFAPFLCAAGLAVFLAQAHGWAFFGLLRAVG